MIQILFYSPTLLCKGVEVTLRTAMVDLRGLGKGAGD